MGTRDLLPAVTPVPNTTPRVRPVLVGVVGNIAIGGLLARALANDRKPNNKIISIDGPVQRGSHNDTIQTP